MPCPALPSRAPPGPSAGYPAPPVTLPGVCSLEPTWGEGTGQVPHISLAPRPGARAARGSFWRPLAMCTELSPRLGVGRILHQLPVPSPQFISLPKALQRGAGRSGGSWGFPGIPVPKPATYPGTPASRCRSPGRSSAGRRRRGWPERTRAGSSCSGTARSPETDGGQSGATPASCCPRPRPPWPAGPWASAAHPLSWQVQGRGGGPPPRRGHRAVGTAFPTQVPTRVGQARERRGQRGGATTPYPHSASGTPSVVPGFGGTCTQGQLPPLWKEAEPLRPLCRVFAGSPA